MVDNFCQIMIILLSMPAIWVVAQKKSWKRWGYVLGMLSIPFYFYATIKSRQWGMILLTIWYAYAWGLGIYNYFFRKDTK